MTQHRLPIVGLAVLVLAFLVLAGLTLVIALGRAVSDDLAALSTARHDDISWNVSQLEIETLNLIEQAHLAAHDQADLRRFRRQFDIFYSRVSTLTNSRFFQQADQGAAIRAGLGAAQDFLTSATPIVDGADADLRAALPALETGLRALRPQMRDLALASLQSFAKSEAMRREDLSRTLIQLAVAVITLVLILSLALLLVVRLYRRGQAVSHDHQVARARFESAIASSLDAVLVVDIAGRIVEFNGAAETVFGYSRAEALGHDMADMIVPPHLRAAHRAGMARFLRTGTQTVIGAGRVRLEGLRKSGEVFPVELSISLSEADGERVFVSYLRDITQDLQAEDELRNARDKAEESERAKSDLLTVMSHEMRTPLNGILGSLALMDQDNLDARQRQHLNSIAISGELLLSHVSDVLDFSSLQNDAAPEPLVPFDVAELATQIADSLRATAQDRGNTLEVEVLTADLGPVVGSRRSLQRCLINLVGNAIKFTSDGVISVEMERLSEGDLVEIRIADTGVGIAPENLDRVFEEFVTIDTGYDRENVGTGLGLAITRRLVDGMGGALEVDSILGEGSLFTLRVPLPPAAEAPRQVAPDAPAQSAQNGQRVLVVDDNPINRLVLSEMIGRLGFEVLQAVDGHDALRQIGAQRFEMVFLDISMPGIDGIETLHRIRGLEVAWRDLPAYAVTAHATAQDRARIMTAPFRNVLVKPVHPDDMRRVLAATGDEGEAVENAFLATFGAEKYAEALGDLQGGIAALAGLISARPDLSDDIRALAHKQAGTAAVLDLPELTGLLQSIEACCAEDWADIRAARLAALEAVELRGG